MEWKWMLGLFFLACVLILCIKTKGEFIVRGILRFLFGSMSIYFINQIIAATGLAVCLGINLYSMGTVVLFGIPGVLLLYGIQLVSTVV